eukprot:gene11829-2322_t
MSVRARIDSSQWPELREEAIGEGIGEPMITAPSDSW